MKKSQIASPVVNYIMENHREETVTEMAKNTKEKYGNVYNYMLRHNIEMRLDRPGKSTKPERPGDRVKEGFFDSSARSNWMI